MMEAKNNSDFTMIKNDKIFSTKKPAVREREKYTLGIGIIQILMTIVAILFAAPIFIILNYSFKTVRELYLSSPLALPQSFNIANYISAFRKLDLVTTFTNTFFYTALSVFILVIMCGAASWAIARPIMSSS